MIHNQHFYNLNETRDYPLDDRATATSTNGVRLPPDILCDLTMRYPKSLGLVPFVSAVSVTASLVTVTLQSVDDVAQPTLFRPLAAVSLARDDIEPGRQYALQAQSEGVGGFIVFGHGIDEPYSGRFTPAAGLLTPRTAKAYRPFPVTSLGKLNNAVPLNGIVRLRGEQPLQVVGEDREINGVLRRVAVIRLAAGTGEQAPENLHRAYAGPCGDRPESKTCGPFEPIESINGVTPDCDGKITIEFDGCATLAGYPDDSSAVIDCGLSLKTACGRKALPDGNGRLPSDLPAQCVDYEDVSLSLPDDGEGGGGTNPPAEDSLSFSYDLIGNGSLPYFMTFDAAHASRPLDNQWKNASGKFSFVVDDVPTADEATASGLPTSSVSAVGCKASDNSVAARNVAAWYGVSDHTRSLKYSTRMKMLSRVSGAKSNGGIVVNFSRHSTIAGRSVYYVVEADRDAMEFRISKFNGTTLNRTSAFVGLTNIAANVWHTLTAKVVHTTGNQVQITGRLTGPNGLDATIGPLTVNNFLPDDGFPGLHADRAETRFAYFKVEAASA